MAGNLVGQDGHGQAVHEQPPEIGVMHAFGRRGFLERRHKGRILPEGLEQTVQPGRRKRAGHLDQPLEELIGIQVRGRKKIVGVHRISRKGGHGLDDHLRHPPVFRNTAGHPDKITGRGRRGDRGDIIPNHALDPAGAVRQHDVEVGIAILFLQNRFFGQGEFIVNDIAGNDRFSENLFHRADPFFLREHL